MESLNTAQQLLASNFDIQAYEDVASAAYIVRHPDTGAPTSFVIQLAGPEHPSRRNDSLNRQRRVRAEIMTTGRVQLDDPLEEEDELTDQLVRYTLGWEGLTAGGEPVAFSPDAARKLYQDPKRRWLRDQVKGALDERKRFIRRCAQG